MAEALALLTLARFLIARVPMRLWRSSLGRVAQEITPGETRPVSPLARAIDRAATRLPGETVCLPRAMAMQWMMRRRGLASALVFGMDRAQPLDTVPALHAWVEAGGRVVIGADPARQFARGLVLAQP